MLLTLKLPLVHSQIGSATIYAIHAQEGCELKLGSKLLDFAVDLSNSVPHDCPPVTNYQVTIREPVWLRRLDVAVGDSLKLEDCIGLFSTIQDEPIQAADATAIRSVRVAIAGIIRNMDW